MERQYELELRKPSSVSGGVHLLQMGNLPAIVALDSGPDPLAGRNRAQKAQPSLLRADITASDAFRLTLVQCRWHIAANASAFVENQDAEALHQLRVGLRRLRVALTSFGGEFRSPQFEAVRLRAKVVTQQLAPARDLDVFVSELFEPVANANGSQEAFAVLRLRAHEARRSAFGEAFAAVSGSRLRMLMKDVTDITDGRGWPLPPHPGCGAARGVHAYEAPARMVAGRILSHRFRKTSKRARRLETLSGEERHGLRIDLKKLRYAAEFFAPFFGAAAAEKFMERLGRMQDVLGAVNDVAVAKNILEMLVSFPEGGDRISGTELSFAAGLIYGWHLERAAFKWREAVSRWKKFARTQEFWAVDAAR